MKYKMLEGGGGIAVNEKGLPIVITDDEKEMGLDALHLYSKVPTLQNEVKQFKTNYEDLKGKISIFEGIEDLAEFKEKATKAMETVSNLDQKKLLDANEVEVIKKQAQDALNDKINNLTKGYEEKLDGQKKTVEKLTSQIYQFMVSDRFSNSPFVKEKLAMTSTMARKYFGENFKVEETEKGTPIVVGYLNGEKIYSQERVGELASFDEALNIMVEKDPDKEKLLVGQAGGGSGAGNSGSGGGSGSKIDQLKKEYKAAVDSNNMVLAISIKNRLFREGVSVT